VSSIYNRYSAYSGAVRKKTPATVRAEPEKKEEPRLEEAPARPERKNEITEKPKGKPMLFGIDADDLILLALIFLLYRESGDEEFLIILGVLAFSILSPGKRPVI